MEATQRPEGLDHPLVPKIMRAMSRAHVWLYQRSGGRLGGTWRVGSAFRQGVPVLLLTTIGRKTGISRTTPLLYLRDAPDGDRYFVVGSQGGLPKDPLWLSNLRANPDVEVQVGARRLPMRARIAGAEERSRLWPRLVALYADFANYQAWTERTIPVVILEPRG
jgi:deazaflavin-dependent oxidoreductase (nitroreductase family)